MCCIQYLEVWKYHESVNDAPCSINQANNQMSGGGGGVRDKFGEKLVSLKQNISFVVRYSVNESVMCGFLSK